MKDRVKDRVKCMAGRGSTRASGYDLHPRYRDKDGVTREKKEEGSVGLSRTSRFCVFRSLPGFSCESFRHFAVVY